MWHELKQNWRESWSFTRKMFRLAFNRYWLLWILNLIIGIQLILWLNRILDFHYGLDFVFIVVYYSLSPLTLLLWLPQYLDPKKPHLYRGLVKSIGDWIGKPYPTR